MKFDYTKLNIRIKEVLDTEENFSAAMKWTTKKTTKKLNNEVYFYMDEIIECVKLLNIPTNEINTYFFKAI